MRRTYISPEFIYNKVHGTLNMNEHSSFFGSKMLNIDNSIIIKSDNITYYQLAGGEQIDFYSESSLSPVTYNLVQDKKDNHTIILDESQTDYQLNNNTQWIVDIKIKDILTNYLFATMKKWRTFEGVRNNMTLFNQVDTALLQYIKSNVLTKYSFTKIEFYLQSVDLLTIGGLRYNNQFDSTVETNENLWTKFETETDPNGLDIRLKFSQPKPSTSYAFNYYFNLYFDKI